MAPTARRTGLGYAPSLLRWTAALLLAVALVASCSNGTGTVDTTTPVSNAVAESSSVPAVSAPSEGEAPAGGLTSELVWDEATVLEEGLVDQIVTTDRGLVGYRFSHGLEAWTSQDGVDWISIDASLETSMDDISISSITVGESGYTAIGSDEWNVEVGQHNELMRRSRDGLDWSRHPLELEQPDLGEFDGVGVQSVVEGGSQLVLRQAGSELPRPAQVRRVDVLRRRDQLGPERRAIPGGGLHHRPVPHWQRLRRCRTRRRSRRWPASVVVGRWH